MTWPTDPRVYISGAASGLGRELALQLAKQRARVLLADIDTNGAEQTAQQVEAAGGTAIVHRCDVTAVADIESAARLMQQRFGGVDIVINNAGVAAAGEVGELSLSDWTWLMDINLRGVVHGCHVFAPLLKAQRSGYVLNIASAAGFCALPRMGAYNVSKAAVIALSETLYGELAAADVHVSVLCPTFFQTGLMQRFRTPSAANRELAEWAFARTTRSATAVAAYALRGLRQERLMLLPQPEAKLAWWLKRSAPALFHKVIAWGAARAPQ